jgi:F-type H+-transporting ATPase subunit b
MIIVNEFEINTNILETNVINILILLGLIIYVGKGFIENSVDQRRKQILKTLENLENNLFEANQNFIESTKQLKQINLIILQIQEENKTQKLSALERKYEKLKNEINSIFDILIQNINKNKIDSLETIERFLLNFSIGKVLKNCAKLNEQEQQKIVDNIIAKLGGDN